MRIKAKQYAGILLGLSSLKKGEQLKSGLYELAALIMRNRDGRKLPQIIAKFEELWNAENNIVSAELTSARNLDSQSISLIKGYLNELTGAEKLVLSERIDKNIIGGIIIKYGDKVLDASIRNNIENLKNSLKK